jgi:hypothetical protein
VSICPHRIDTAAPAAVNSALLARAFFTRAHRARSGNCDRVGDCAALPQFQGPAMKHLPSDLATALVSFTLCIAAASMVVVVFAGVA